MLQKAVFLDKDGTLIEDVPYNVDPAQIEFTSGAIEGAVALHLAGYALVIVSNQSGAARGFFREEQIFGVEARLRELLGAEGAPLAGFYYCPHHPEGVVSEYSIVCECRKPKPGMLRDAARDLRLDLARSWMIGDILDDVEAGRRCGCRTVLIDNGHETQWKIGPERTPHYVAADFLAAAELILSADRQPALLGNAS